MSLLQNYRLHQVNEFKQLNWVCIHSICLENNSIGFQGRRRINDPNSAVLTLKCAVPIHGKKSGYLNKKNKNHCFKKVLFLFKF